MKMRTKLLISFFLISFIPLLLSTYLYYKQSTKAIEKELGDYTVEVSQQVAGNLNTFYQESVKLRNMIESNSEVQRFLTFRKTAAEASEIYSILNIRDLLSSISNVQKILTAFSY